MKLISNYLTKTAIVISNLYKSLSFLRQFYIEHNFRYDKDIDLSRSIFGISCLNCIIILSTLDSVYLECYLFILWRKAESCLRVVNLAGTNEYKVF